MNKACIVLAFMTGFTLGITFVESGIPDGGEPKRLTGLVNICEKSLPRDQKCIIVAVPAVDVIKGETK